MFFSEGRSYRHLWRYIWLRGIEPGRVWVRIEIQSDKINPLSVFIEIQNDKIKPLAIFIFNARNASYLSQNIVFLYSEMDSF